MARAVIVISFELPEGKSGLDQFQSTLDQIKPIFAADETVKVTGAVRKKAKQVLDILESKEN